MNDLQTEIKLLLSAYPPVKKYLIGVSGGRDSQVLLHALHSLKYRKLVVCHVDHGLRGASSRADCNVVRRTASKFDLEFETTTVDTRKSAREQKASLELAARNLRFDFFSRCARKHRCRRLLLAHHADDQIETSLFNFLRGAGAAGIAGIKPVAMVSGLEIIRPMLEVTSETITSYARENKIRWREDISNAGLEHTRNRLRLEVIPAINKAIGPSFKTAVLRAGKILREEDAWMESLVPEISERLSCKLLTALAPALRRRTVLRWLRAQGVPEAGFQETLRTLSLLQGGSGPSRASLPGGRDVRRRKGEIFLEG